MRQEIVDHYNNDDKSQRLKNDIGPLELVRTQELISRYLPPPPATILDVGGASGVYSFWLAGLGYQVHLVDIVPLHIEQAVRKMQLPDCPKLASARVGDARDLPFVDEFADVVMMHGPLYHLTDRASTVCAPLRLAFAITRCDAALTWFSCAGTYLTRFTTRWSKPNTHGSPGKPA